MIQSPANCRGYFLNRNDHKFLNIKEICSCHLEFLNISIFCAPAGSEKLNFLKLRKSAEAGSDDDSISKFFNI